MKCVTRFTRTWKGVWLNFVVPVKNRLNFEALLYSSQTRMCTAVLVSENWTLDAPRTGVQENIRLLIYIKSTLRYMPYNERCSNEIHGAIARRHSLRQFSTQSSFIQRWYNTEINSVALLLLYKFLNSQTPKVCGRRQI